MIPIHHLKDEKRKEIRVIKLGSLSNYNIAEPHRHDYIELFIFDNGGGVHEIDFIPLEVESNSIHIVSSGRVHQMKRELNSDGFVLLFHPSIFEFDRHIAEFLFELDCFDISEIKPSFTFSPEDQLEVMSIAQKIWKYSQSTENYREQLILVQLNLLCLFCLREMPLNNKDQSKDQSYYSQFRHSLRTHFKVHKKVNYYADEIGITARKLNDIVLAKAGLHVSKIIQKQIVLEAKRLLNSGMASKEIAYELNFDDPGHFSKFFKNQTGLSPTDFQKVHL